jgi:hypothetical protein
MRNIKKIIGAAAILAVIVFGLTLASCHASCDGKGTCSVDGLKGSFCTSPDCAVTKKADGKNKVKCDC